jgi:hypothetical protein
MQVERNLLYYYLPEFELYRSRIQANTTKATSITHLDLLIDCIKTIYIPISQDLLPLLGYSEITYDLLPLLFKLNTLVYTRCFDTKKSWYIIYDSAEEKVDRLKEKYFSIVYRYLDFNSKITGKASIYLAIPKFRGIKRINTLRAFPLKYHQDENQVKADLIEYGRKFVALMDISLVYYRSKAFYIDDRDTIRLSVDS